MNRRTLAYVVIVLGIIYLVLAATLLHQYREIARVFASYGISEADFVDLPIGATRQALFTGSIACFGLGLSTLTVGAGLFLAKEWARKLWLVMATLLPLLHLVRLVVDYKLGPLWTAERGLELIAVLLLALISWRVLSNARLGGSVPATTAT
jgi:hypothetical protein